MGSTITSFRVNGLGLRVRGDCEDDYRDLMEDPVLLAILFTFLTFSSILLLNLLIAQLNVSYVRIYSNMVGYARLKRAEVQGGLMKL